MTSKFVVPQNVAEQFLNTALEAQGTSPGRIIEVLSSSDGEPQNIAQNINSEIKATILEPNGDAFRVNLGGLKQLLGNTAELSVSKLNQDSSLSSSLRPKIDEFLEYRSRDLEGWIDRNPIPVGFFVEAKRRRRDTAHEISKRDIISDLLNSLLDLVNTLFGGVLDGVLNGVATTIGSALGGILDAVTNILVPAVSGLLNAILSPITSIISNLISAVGSVVSSVVNAVPILGPIFASLNQAVKSILGETVNTVKCAVGEALVSPVINLLDELINAILPCGSSCTPL